MTASMCVAVLTIRFVPKLGLQVESELYASTLASLGELSRKLSECA